MKTYTIRISQDLQAYYNAYITVEANSEEAAINKAKKLSQKQLEEKAFDWEQVTDNASAVGKITIQEVVSEEN